MAVDVKNITYDYMRYSSNMVGEVTSFIKEFKDRKENERPMEPKEERNAVKSLKQVISTLKVFVTG